MADADIVDNAEGFSFPPISYAVPSMSDYNFTAGTEKFNAAGMAGIFYAANKTLDAIFPKYDQYYTYNFKLNPENMLNFSNVDIMGLVTDNKGPLGIFATWIIIAVIVTFSGIIWCLAKCCCEDKGCCSRKSDEDVQASKILTKQDKCKRTACSVLFAALVIAFTFGLVCCFVTNELMQSNVKKMPTHAVNALEDVASYINISQKQISVVLEDNYNLLSSNIIEVLERGGDRIQRGLAERTGAQALANLTNVMDAVENVKSSLSAVNTASKSIKTQARRLQRGLQEIKDKILQRLDSCGIPKCVELRNSKDIQELKLEDSFQELPDVSSILSDLEQFFSQDVKSSIDQGQARFNQLSILIQTEINPFIPQVVEKLDQTGKNLSNVAADWNAKLSEVLQQVWTAKAYLQDLEMEANKYVPYWYYVMLGVCVALAFIFALLALGIFIGFCGKQPGSEYSDECCSRKTGSSFINCGIFFIFLTYFLFTIVALAHFIVGGAGGQVICEAMNNLDNRTEEVVKLPTLPNQTLKNGKISYKVPQYSAMLTACKRGASAYDAFKLRQVYDVRSFQNIASSIGAEAERLASAVNVSNDLTREIQFLSPGVRAQIDGFASSRITTMNFESFVDQLSESITAVDLQDVINRLDALLKEPEAADLGDDLLADLANSVMNLQSLQNVVAAPMVKLVNESIEHLRSVANEQKDLVTRLQTVVDAAQSAQDALRSGVQDTVRELTEKFGKALQDYISDYANFTTNSALTTLGMCRPLYDAYNATVSSVCVNVLYPVTGFWLALSFLLLLFIPLLITGCSLSRVYTKFKVGGYESVNSYVHSATYYPSAYGDGDTIPLSLNPNSRRHKRGGGAERGAHRSEARYSHRFEDAAHKAWSSQVYNNHHTPPTSGEYERPPPYYYPGPAQ